MGKGTKKKKCIEFRDSTNNNYTLKVVNNSTDVAFEVSQMKLVSSYHF